MKTTLVQVQVKPEQIDAFIAATLDNAKGSNDEPGNVRFDVVQLAEDPTKFILYEVFEDADAAAAHKETAHYLTWRETVADMMAEPRKGVPYVQVYPSSGE